MRKCLLLTALLAFSSMSLASRADDEASPKAKSNPAGKTVVGGATITVGPNGEVKVSGLKEAKSPKAADKAGKGSPKVEIETHVIGKAIIVGPDGKVEVKDLKDLKGLEEGFPKELLDKAAKVTGKVKVVTIGPDGKRQESESDIGSVSGDSPFGIQVDLGDLLKKAGVTLPPDAQKALEAAGKTAGSQAGKSDDISAKLDKILERLERVEKDVAKLKTQKGK